MSLAVPAGGRVPRQIDGGVAACREIGVERQRLRLIAGNHDVPAHLRALVTEVAQHDRELVARTLVDPMHVGDRDLRGRRALHRDRHRERLRRGTGDGAPVGRRDRVLDRRADVRERGLGWVSCGTAIVIGTVVATCGSSWISSSPNASHDAAAVPRLPVASVALSFTVRRRFAVWFDTTRSCSSDAPASRVTARPEPATCASDRPDASAGTELAAGGLAFGLAGAPGSAATGRAASDEHSCDAREERDDSLHVRCPGRRRSERRRPRSHRSNSPIVDRAPAPAAPPHDHRGADQDHEECCPPGSRARPGPGSVLLRRSRSVARSRSWFSASPAMTTVPSSSYGARPRSVRSTSTWCVPGTTVLVHGIGYTIAVPGHEGVDLEREVGVGVRHPDHARCRARRRCRRWPCARRGSTPSGVAFGSAPVTVSFGARGPGTSISTAIARWKRTDIEKPASPAPALLAAVSAADSGTEALTPARYWPGSRRRGDVHGERDVARFVRREGHLRGRDHDPARGQRLGAPGLGQLHAGLLAPSWRRPPRPSPSPGGRWDC